VRSAEDCEDQIITIESVLDSMVYALRNRTELENVIPSASHRYRIYDASKILHVEVKGKLKSSRLKFKDVDRKLRKWLANDHAKIVYCIDELGFLCAYEAENKGTDKAEKITVTNEMWRLSQEDIKCMVRKAEEFAEEDKKVKEKIDTCNVLATYVYNMKNQVSDNDKLADKLEADEKGKIEAVLPSIREENWCRQGRL
ncbi:luminal binding protein 5-like protein, partial [Tanacetum coccineum]